MSSRAERLKAVGNPHADPADPAPVRTRFPVIARLAAAHLPARGSVLDLGCGAGEILSMLQTSRPDACLSAADAYRSCLEGAASRAHLDGQYLIAEQGFDLSGIEKRFDVVVFSHTLEHLARPADAMMGVMGLVKPGGVAIVAVPNLVRPDTLVRALFRRHYVNRGHVVGWDHSHFRNFLEEILGLEVLGYEADGVPLFPRGLTNRVPALLHLETLAARAAPYWSFSNIAVIAAGGSRSPVRGA